MYKYQEIYDALAAKIRKGKLKPGDRIASEKGLAEQFGCNYHTVRHALALLVEENRIERRVGSGTFVKGRRAGGASAGYEPAGLNDSRPADLGAAEIGGAGRTAEPLLTARTSPARPSVGVILQAHCAAYAAVFLECLHTVAESMGVTLGLRTISDFDQAGLDVVGQLAGQGCGSIIIPRLADGTDVALLAGFVRSSPLPVVLAELFPGLEANCCDRPDVFGRGDTLAAELACAYFRAMGHESLAYFGPDARHNRTLQRKLMAYNLFTSREGLVSRVGLVGQPATDVDGVVSRWTDGKAGGASTRAGPLAVVCHDYYAASRMLTSLHHHGVKVPGDVAVIALSHSPEAVSADPPLTTLQYSTEDTARAMVTHALALARGESDQSQDGPGISMVVRRSCGGVALAGDRLASILDGLELRGGYRIDAATPGSASDHEAKDAATRVS